jgi:hypothetical protein
MRLRPSARAEDVKGVSSQRTCAQSKAPSVSRDRARLERLASATRSGRSAPARPASGAIATQQPGSRRMQRQGPCAAVAARAFRAEAPLRFSLNPPAGISGAAGSVGSVLYPCVICHTCLAARTRRDASAQNTARESPRPCMESRTRLAADALRLRGRSLLALARRGRGAAAAAEAHDVSSVSHFDVKATLCERCEALGDWQLPRERRTGTLRLPARPGSAWERRARAFAVPSAIFSLCHACRPDPRRGAARRPRRGEPACCLTLPPRRRRPQRRGLRPAGRRLPGAPGRAWRWPAARTWCRGRRWRPSCARRARPRRSPPHAALTPQSTLCCAPFWQAGSRAGGGGRRVSAQQDHALDRQHRGERALTLLAPQQPTQQVLLQRCACAQPPLTRARRFRRRRAC